MGKIITSILESFRNPEWAQVALIFGVLWFFCNLFVMGGKLSFFGFDAVKPSYSNQAKERRNQLKKFANFLLILIFLLAILAISPLGDSTYFKQKKEEDDRLSLTDESVLKGGYGDLPIIRIDRSCLPIKSHEYENYSLFAGSFEHEENAIRLVSTLDMYNIRDANYFPRLCDSINLIGGDFLVFLGRRCQTLPSIQRYEKKYETMFREEDFIDLKILKFVD